MKTTRIQRRVELFATSATIAVAFALAHSGTGIAQVAFQATPTVVQGDANVSRLGPVGGSAATDRVFLNSSATVINWTTLDQTTNTTIDVLPQNTVLSFVGSNPNAVVLNRIFAATPGQSIALNGTVNFLDFNNAVSTGSVWFYSPGGIIAGSTSRFNAGSLVLTASDINTTGGLFGPGGTIRFRGPLTSQGAVTVNPGAQINLPNAGSYLALVAPTVTMNGTATVNGSVGYIAAQQADVRINVGLFDINFIAGTDNPTAITHTGTTTGPAQGANGQIVFAAVGKNTAISMLLSGSIGYTPAATAAVQNGTVVLLGGYATGFNPQPVNNTPVDITIGNTAFTSSVVSRATGTLLAAPTGALSFSANADLSSNTAASLRADLNANISVGGDLTITSRSADGATGGQASLSVQGNGGQPVVTVGGITTIDARGVGLAGLTGGTGSGGTATLSVNNGRASLGGPALLIASGTGGAGQNAGGDGIGGTATVSARSAVGASQGLFAGTITAEVSGIGGDAFQIPPPNFVAGRGVGGNATLTVQNAPVTATDVTLTAIGRGGQADAAGTGGSAQGGTATYTSLGSIGTFDTLSLNASASYGLAGPGGTTGSSRGGTAAVDVTTGVLRIAQGLDVVADGGVFARSSPFSVPVPSIVGNARGGTARLNATGTIDSPNAVALIAARARTANGSGAVVAGVAQGGDAIATVGAGAQVGLLGLVMDTQATGGNGVGPTGGGGNAIGGNTALTSRFGVLTIGAGGLSMAAGGNGGSGVTGGNANGGDTLFDTGGTITLGGAALLSANGVGGIGTTIGGTGRGGRTRIIQSAFGGGTNRLTGGILSATANGTGGPGATGVAGGAGLGGIVDFTAAGGSMAVTSIGLTADGFGGSGGDGVLSAAGPGGDATGGSARFSNAGGLVQVATSLSVTSRATGGVGGLNVVGGSGQAFAGGNGGNATARDATIAITGGTTDIATYTIDTTARGGAGGAGVNTGAPVTGLTGGSGGIAQGGNGLLTLSSAIGNTGAISVISNAIGGNGASGEAGGAGGSATAGTARATVTNVPALAGGLQLLARATGGHAGRATLATSANGGNATGGEGTLSVSGTGSGLTLGGNVFQFIVDAGATGGNGGDAGPTFANAAGGNGGTATGGTANALASGGIIDIASVPELTFGSSAVGGSGGAGSNGGIGGSGGAATGGAVNVTSVGTDAVITIGNSGNFVSSGTGGSGGAGSTGATGTTGATGVTGSPGAPGGVGGTGGIGGQGATGGDGAIGTGGAVIFTAQDGGTLTGANITLASRGQGGDGGQGGTGGIGGGGGTGGAGGFGVAGLNGGSGGRGGNGGQGGTGGDGGLAAAGIGGTVRLAAIGGSVIFDRVGTSSSGITGAFALPSAGGVGGRAGSGGVGGGAILPGVPGATGPIGNVGPTGIPNGNFGFAFSSGGNILFESLVGTNGTTPGVFNLGGGSASVDSLLGGASGNGGSFGNITVRSSGPANPLQILRFGSLSLGAGSASQPDPSGTIDIIADRNRVEIPTGADVQTSGAMRLSAVGDGVIVTTGSTGFAAGGEIRILHDTPGAGPTVTGETSIDFRALGDIRIESTARVEATGDLSFDSGTNMVFSGSATAGGALTANAGASIIVGGFVSGGSVSLTGGFDVRVNPSARITSTGSLDIRAVIEDVFVDTGASLTGSSITLNAGDDIRIASGATAIGSADMTLDAGGSAFSTPTPGDIPSVIIAGNLGGPASGNISIIGEAVQITGAVSANDLSVDLRNVPAPGTGSNDFGQLSPNCVGGNICLGSATLTGALRLGPATGFVNLPNAVRIDGAFSSSGATVRALGLISLPGRASIGTGGGSFGSTGGDVNFSNILSFGALDLAAGGSLIGGDASGGFGLRLTAGSDITFGSISTGGILGAVAGRRIIGTLATNNGDFNNFRGKSGIDVATVDARGALTAVSTEGAVRFGRIDSGGLLDINVSGDLRIDSGTIGGFTRVEAGGTVVFGQVSTVGTLSINAGGAVSLEDILTTGSATNQEGAVPPDLIVRTPGAISLRGGRIGRNTDIEGGSLVITGNLAATSNVRVVTTGDAALNATSAGLRIDATTGGRLSYASLNSGTTTNLVGGTIITGTGDIVAGANATALALGGTVTTRNVTAGEDIILSTSGPFQVTSGNLIAGDDIRASGRFITTGNVTTTGLGLDGDGLGSNVDLQGNRIATSIIGSAGSILMAASEPIDFTSIDSRTGTIIRSFGPITGGSAAAGTTLEIQGGVIDVGNLSAGGALRLVNFGTAENARTGTLTGATVNASITGSLTTGAVSATGAVGLIGNLGLNVASATSTNGGVQLNAFTSGPVTSGALRAGGEINVRAQTGTVTLTTLDAGGLILLRAGGGALQLDRATAGGLFGASATGNIGFGIISAGGTFQVTTPGTITGTSATSLGGAPNFVSGDSGVTLPTLITNGVTTLSANNGAVTIAIDLRSTADVTATGRAVTLRSSGVLSTSNIAATAGNLDVQSVGNLAVTASGATGNVTLTSTGGSVRVDSLGVNGALMPVNGSITGSTTATLGSASVTGGLSVRAGGLASFGGTSSGRTIDVNSGDIAIGSQGQLGTAGVTTALTLTNSGTTQTVIGGTGTVAGVYRLDAAEILRVRANNISIQTPLVGGPAGTAINSARTPDVLIEGFTLNGGTQLATTGTLSILNAGKMRVTGDVVINGMATDAGLSLRADEAIEVQGSIALRTGTDLSGRLTLSSSNIIAATPEALAAFGTATSLQAISDRAGQSASATPNDGGWLQAGGMTAQLLNSTLIIQNTGVQSANPRNYADRRGFTVGAGGFTVVQAGTNPVRIAVNGRQIGTANAAGVPGVGGFITGVQLIPDIRITGVRNAAGVVGVGVYDQQSTVNGCLIANPASCNAGDQQDNPRDFIEDFDFFDEGGLGNLLPPFLIELRDYTGFIDQPLIDEPVTGSANDDLWAVDDDRCDPSKGDICPK